MKTNLFLILSLLSSLAFGQGDAPPFIKGQSQASQTVSSVLEVPNAQSTKTSSSKSLLETGNKNLLSNPSFEHLAYNTGWTSLSGTSELETTVVIDGKKAHKITYSSAFVSLMPSDVTTNAAQFADLSVQGVASVMVKAPFAVKLCARNAGVTSTTLCSSPTKGLNKWEQLYYPFGLGATSNGFEIKSDALVTGVAYFDDAFMGPAKVTANTSVVGPWTTFTPTGSWTTNTTYTGKYRQVGQNYEYNIQISTTGAPTSIGLTVTLPHTIDSANLNSSTAGNEILGTSKSLDVGVNEYTPGYVRYSTSTTVDVRYSGSSGITAAITHAAPFTFGAGDSISLNFTAPIVGLAASTNTLSSTNGNTSWASCGHAFTDFQGFGTVTNIETQCKRDGDDLLMRGKFTPGTGTGVEARLNLKLNSLSLTSAGTGKIPSIQSAGFGAFTGTGATSSYNLIEPSVGYITFSQQNASTGSLTKLLGSSYGTGSPITINARVPIANWENSNVIVASLKDTPTTIGSTGSDIQSVYFGSGANCNADCTTGNCTICSPVGSKITSVSHAGATGSYRFNGIDGLKYNCNGTFYSTGSNINGIALHNKASSTSSYANVQLGLGTANYNGGYASVTCVGIP